MKKTLLTTLFALISMFTFAQVPYFAKAPGDKNLYGYTSAKFCPGINNIESYTTFQYGISDYMALGTDVYTGGKEAYWGFMLRSGYKVNKWFGIGGTATPSFDLGDNFKFSYFTGGLFMNGAITKDENLYPIKKFDLMCINQILSALLEYVFKHTWNILSKYIMI